MGRVSEEKRIGVLVVIPHHTGDLINRCLRSVKESDLAGLDIKIVVISSGIQPFHDVSNIRSIEGPAHKRNIGVSTYGRNDDKYVIFLDDDVELSPYCIRSLVYEMEENPQCGMGFAKILNMEYRDEFDDCGSWLTWTGFLYSRAGNHQKDIGQFNEPCKVLSSKSATCIVRKDAFYNAGGFDKDYFILGEETDLSWRMWLQGYEVWYFPQAVSWHAFNTKFKPKAKHYTLERIHFHGCSNYLSLLLTNLPISRLWWVMPVHITVWIASAGLFLLRGRFMRAWHILRGIAWTVTHLGKILEKRRKVRANCSDGFLNDVIYSPTASYYIHRLFKYVVQGLHG